MSDTENTSWSDGWFNTSLNALLDYGAAALNNYYSKKAAKESWDRNLQMWNLENEYNHPINQMVRLRDAGLNPNLVYGTGTSTLAASSKSAPVAQQSFPQLDILGKMNAYQDLKQKDATTENIKAQKQVNEANAREAEARAKIAEKDAEIYMETGVNPQRPVSQNVFSNVSHYVRRVGEYVGDRFGDWWYSLPEGNYNGGKLY